MKRILSIILAVAMLMAICPVVFAADTFDGYKYVFTSAALKEGLADKTYSGLSALAGLSNENEEIVDTTNSAPWRPAAHSYVLDLEGTCLDDSCFAIFFNCPDPRSSFAIALDVKKGGTYIPSLDYIAQSGAPTVDVYLIKEGAALQDHPDDTTAGFKFYPGLAGSMYESEYNSIYYYIRDSASYGSYKVYTNDEDKLLIAKDLNMTSGTVSFEDKKLALDGNTTYFLLFVVKGSNNYSNPMMKLKSFSLTPVQDEELKEAFTVEETPNYSYAAPEAIGIAKDNTKIETEDNNDGTYNLTAPEKNEAKENFLYWALGLTGNKRIVSFDKTLQNYVPAQEGRNYLIAVYEGDVDTSAKEFYNQNGQLIPKATEDTTVSMPGYGSTNKWVQHGETNIYVAQYDKTKDNRDKVTVTVVGGTGTETVLFGETVTCTADETKGTFKCWTKSNIYGATDEAPEIVSCDPEYTFKAWENCTVTAVYEDHHYTGEKMKIIIDTFDVAAGVTGIMAEFIGLDSAVEKGIMFKATGKTEATKIAMTTKDNQFTVIADGDGTYEGYAIVEENDGSYTLITDGKYE